MYKYSDQSAETYSKLGIKRTTYEPGFYEAKRVLGKLSGKIALDFGSGAGRTARLLRSMGAERVVGVDHNQSMIDLTKKIQDAHFEFIKIDGKIPFEQKTFDVALSAHVFVEVGSIKEMKHICEEVYRVLKPRGIFVIITNNSEAIGKNYLSYGYPKKGNLKSGEKIPCTIKRDNESLVIDDYYWSENDYRRVLEEVGFSVTMTFPTASGSGWLDEAKIAPNVVIKCIKL